MTQKDIIRLGIVIDDLQNNIINYCKRIDYYNYIYKIVRTNYNQLFFYKKLRELFVALNKCKKDLYNAQLQLKEYHNSK